MKTLTHRGYAARIEFDAEDRIFVGHLAGIRDIVGFHGRSVDELETAFHEAVDDYLAACTRLGQSPDKPCSGRMMLRLSPELHARISSAAQLSGDSVNQWVAKALDGVLHTKVPNAGTQAATKEEVRTMGRARLDAR